MSPQCRRQDLNLHCLYGNQALNLQSLTNGTAHSRCIHVANR